MSKNTKVLFGLEARKKLFEGLEIAAEAVMCTLGPKGKTVIIQQDGTTPIVTKDGVTVSKSIRLKDPVKRMGAELIREAAAQTNEIAGDGTTTSTVLTHAMVKEGLRLLEAGYTAKELTEALEVTREEIDNSLRKSGKLLTTTSEIAQIATISANGDKFIGDLIAQAMEKVGKDGIISVEDAKGMSTTLNFVEGMQFERGYISPYFVTNQDRMTVAYQDAYVLITDRKLSSMKELIPILERVMESRKPLLIIADDIEGEALQGLVVNRVNANLPIVAVKAPGYGNHKTELLSDMAILAGTKLVSASTGMKVSELTIKDLGTLKRIVVDSKTTTLIGPDQSREKEIQDHVANLRLQLEDVTLSSNDVIKLKTRIAKLADGVAIIRVGGATELEMIERKYRIEDALNATRAAAEEGIVQGGGMALFNAAKNHDARELPRLIGSSIVTKACYTPLQRISSNAGHVPEVIINELSKLSDINLGYNAASGKFEDLIESGVIDPVKVTRTALKNAASVAATFINLDAVVVNDEEDIKNE